ncbi:MAG: ribbon-helix-helix protein, CopG family [Daejeonella sp.]|uniref:ribbon-helix-helix protein, CopG family n=1 Tax=Daejeonella sp. TaxID=2805397 RepID=UPI0027352CC6|nr:ribbon-helix-helix protein, CopG family [Daejeonella sp.]MDP3467867.1 ribbon-helix-helix protein, CopG family [Daejeonella sp.]
MATFTSSLPDGLLQLLEEKAKELSMPKNKLIEQALRLYLDHLNRAAYIRSYKQMAEDTDLLAIAEEGMADYFEQLENEAG